MTSRPRLFHQRNRFWAGVLLALLLTTAPAAALGIPQSQLTFKNVDIQTVIEEVARLTGTTFLFDPARVQGKITVLAAGESTPAQALQLLRSALALHGYLLVARPEGMWILSAQEATGAGVVVRVIRLTYGRRHPASASRRFTRRTALSSLAPRLR
jgi:type II secretory pathway component GspD/PulD (secretin)